MPSHSFRDIQNLNFSRLVKETIIKVYYMFKKRSKMIIGASCPSNRIRHHRILTSELFLVHTVIVLPIVIHGHNPVLKSRGSSLEASDVWTFVLIKNFSKPFLSKSQARRSHNQDWTIHCTRTFSWFTMLSLITKIELGVVFTFYTLKKKQIHLEN